MEIIHTIGRIVKLEDKKPEIGKYEDAPPTENWYIPVKGGMYNTDTPYPWKNVVYGNTWEYPAGVWEPKDMAELYEGPPPCKKRLGRNLYPKQDDIDPETDMEPGVLGGGHFYLGTSKLMDAYDKMMKATAEELFTKEDPLYKELKKK